MKKGQAELLFEVNLEFSLVLLRHLNVVLLEHVLDLLHRDPKVLILVILGKDGIQVGFVGSQLVLQWLDEVINSQDVVSFVNTLCHESHSKVLPVNIVHVESIKVALQVLHFDHD